MRARSSLPATLTRRPGGDSVEVAPLGMQTVRGISTPVEVFKLTGLLNAPASGVFRSEKRLTSLVGRGDQLAALELELAHAVKGDGRVIGVVGEAGLGKSRICFEFADACRRQGIRVHEARVLSHGRATPFQPVLELLRDVLSIRPNDKVKVSRQRVTAQLRKRGDFSEALPLVLDFLGLHDAYQPSKQDPAARKHRLLAFVRQLIHSRPHDETVLVVLEDVHWIDQASEEFVEAIVDAIVGTKTMLLLNFRPGYTAPWMIAGLSADPARAASGDQEHRRIARRSPGRRPFAGAGGAQYRRARRAIRFSWKSWCVRWPSAAISRANAAPIASRPASMQFRCRRPCRPY